MREKLTLEQWLLKLLTGRGTSEADAEQIVEKFKQEIENAGDSISWNDAAESFDETYILGLAKRLDKWILAKARQAIKHVKADS